jgi:hypothetical protein
MVLDYRHGFSMPFILMRPRRTVPLNLAAPVHPADSLPHSNAPSLPRYIFTVVTSFPVQTRGQFPSKRGASTFKCRFFIFFHTLLHSPKTQPFCFQAIPHSLAKTPGGGGTGSLPSVITVVGTSSQNPPFRTPSFHSNYVNV